MSNGYQIGIPYLTPVVTKLSILNVAIWIVGVLILQGWFEIHSLKFWFGLVPDKVILDFHVWQFATYMFIHSAGVFHLLFNMLFLWFLGSELEQLWGKRFFLTYYLVCGVGAALIYTAGAFIYYLITNQDQPLGIPVVGASGAIYGILLAYGILFGDRIIYFFGIFPMKAKFFVMILGGMDFLMLMNAGMNSKVANLAHLGGIIAGYLFLVFYPRIRDRWLRRQTKARGRNLKLVVDNDIPPKGPKYWN